MTEFWQEKCHSAEEDDEEGSHEDSGEDCGEGEEQQPQPKRRGGEQRPHRRDTYRSNGKKSGDPGNTVRKKFAKGDGCYICSRPNSYAKCPELKSLGVILRERKVKEGQEEDEVEETKQLGLISLCGAVTKKQSKSPR